MLMRVRPGTDASHKQELLDEWYRAQLRKAVPSLLAKWEPLMNIKVERFFVQRMKTRWGTCNPVARTIRLNTDLAKKPPECLEYILVHEMTHIIEPRHGRKFCDLLACFIPKWRFYREMLNRLPVRHEEWSY
jgi:predicted metal-dependent hydrolase